MDDLLRHRLSKFLVNYGKEIEVLIDKNILRSHVYMV
jgi:hypothetical protein